MSGYAASARLQGGSPRFMADRGSGSRGAPGSGAAAAPASLDHDERDWVELVGRPFGERLESRLADLREAWSQTTFYLFDPESWR